LVTKANAVEGGTDQPHGCITNVISPHMSLMTWQ